MTPNSSLLHAIVYDESAAHAALAWSLVTAWRNEGWRVAGLLEDHIARPERRACDMVLQELVSGARILISEDRGPLARGCRLDADALLRAAESIRHTLGTADLLILNKFGKLECEGGGLRTLIAQAIEAAVPTVIFVPRRNVTAWRSFACSFATEWNMSDLPKDGAAASKALGIRSPLSQFVKLGECAHR